MKPDISPEPNHVPHGERFPDEDVATGAVVDGATLTRDVDEEVDFVVVGSGAAGSVAAHTLAQAGWSVAIVEEGPWLNSVTSTTTSSVRSRRRCATAERRC